MKKLLLAILLVAIPAFPAGKGLYCVLSTYTGSNPPAPVAGYSGTCTTSNTYTAGTAALTQLYNDIGYPWNTTRTGSISSGTNTLTLTSATGVVQGMFLTADAGIPIPCYVDAIVSLTATLTCNATQNVSGGNFYFATSLTSTQIIRYYDSATYSETLAPSNNLFPTPYAPLVIESVAPRNALDAGAGAGAPTIAGGNATVVTWNRGFTQYIGFNLTSTIADPSSCITGVSGYGGIVLQFNTVTCANGYSAMVGMGGSSNRTTYRSTVSNNKVQNVIRGIAAGAYTDGYLNWISTYGTAGTSACFGFFASTTNVTVANSLIYGGSHAQCQNIGLSSDTLSTGNVLYDAKYSYQDLNNATPGPTSTNNISAYTDFNCHAETTLGYRTLNHEICIAGLQSTLIYGTNAGSTTVKNSVSYPDKSLASNDRNLTTYSGGATPVTGWLHLNNNGYYQRDSSGPCASPCISVAYNGTDYATLALWQALATGLDVGTIYDDPSWFGDPNTTLLRRSSAPPCPDCVTLTDYLVWVRRQYIPRNPAYLCGGDDGESRGYPWCGPQKAMIGAIL